MSRRSRRLATVEQYFVRLRGFDIWRRVQVPKCPDHRLIQFLLNSFGWLGRFGQPGDPVADGQSVLSLQRTEAPARDGWLTITAPPVAPQFRLVQLPVCEDEPWFFDAILEGRLRLATRQAEACCVDGDWACPPYGFTTPADYRVFLNVISDPSNAACEEWLRWCPFDPHAFDPRAVTDAMRHKRYGGRDPIAGLHRALRGLARELPQPPWVLTSAWPESERLRAAANARPSEDDPQANRRPFSAHRGTADANSAPAVPDDLADAVGQILSSLDMNASFLP